jgi:prepilin-type N-terminal cleavage/methylation domain-containing protein
MRRDALHPRPSGFTLLEVLISMMLLALIAGICYAAFHLGTRAVMKGGDAVVVAQRFRSATDVLIRQVKSMAPEGAVDREESSLDTTDTYLFFSATPKSMEFVTEAGQLSGGGRAHVSYTIESDPPRLVLTESPYFDAVTLAKGTMDADAPSAVILDGFRSLTLEYLSDDGSDVEWKRSWDYVDMEMLPAAVRVTIEGLPGFDEDFVQEIPVMSAGHGDQEGPLRQDCSAVAGAPSGAGGGSNGPSSGGQAPSNDDEADE